MKFSTAEYFFYKFIASAESANEKNLNRLRFDRVTAMSLVSPFLPARRYASAGTSYGPVSVYLSVTSRCSIERNERINFVFGMYAFFNQFYTVLRKFRYLHK